MAERTELDTGDAVLLDAIGATAVRFDPSSEVGLVLDLEGRLNKLAIRDVHRYILSAGMAAELVARLVVAAQMAEPGGHFREEFEASVAREQAQIRESL
jgi:hypothetical protein